MNLCMDVLRMITVRAIRGRTYAGPNVFDSPSSAGDIRIKGKRLPFISVYCDEQDVIDMEAGGISGGLSPNRIKLVLEVGVASGEVYDEKGEEIGPDDEETEEASSRSALVATDEALEILMGLIARQATDALNSTQRTNPWAEMFRMFTASMIQAARIRRGGPAGDGTAPASRYASRVMIIETGTLGEPVRGADVTEYPFWHAFFTMCEGDEEYGAIAAMIRAHIDRDPDDPLPDWRVIQKQLGIPLDTLRHMQNTPFMRDDDVVAVMQKAEPYDGPLPTEDEE